MKMDLTSTDTQVKVLFMKNFYNRNREAVNQFAWMTIAYMILDIILGATGVLWPLIIPIFQVPIIAMFVYFGHKQDKVRNARS